MAMLNLMNVVYVMEMEFYKSVDVDPLENMESPMGVATVMGISKIA